MIPRVANAADALCWKLNDLPPMTERLRPKRLVVGEILRPHGVRGEVRMRVLTDFPDRLSSLDRIYIGKSSDDRQLAEVGLIRVRFNKQYALLTLDGIRTRNEADRLRSKLVMIDTADAAPLEQDQYYLFQLIGLTVVADGRELGVITDVLQTGANDVYVLATKNQGEVLVPAHQETIDSIDFESGVVTMTLPEGLLTED